MRGFLAVVLAIPAALTLPVVASSAADWATYGSSVSRSGFNSVEKTLTTSHVKSVKQRWSAPVGGLIDAQPGVASRGQIGPRRTRTDGVYIRNEGGRFAPLNAANGHVIWKRKLGAVPTSCADLPSYGITGTPQIDRRRHSVFVVSKGKASELDLATGRTKHKWVITTDPRHEHNWSALTLSHGILYVALAGICDAEPYRGRLVATNVRTHKRVADWHVTGSGGPFGGGIWSFGGVSADSR